MGRTALVRVVLDAEDKYQEKEVESMRFVAWAQEWEGERLHSIRDGDGPEDGYYVYQLTDPEAYGQCIAVPWSCSDAAFLCDERGNPIDDEWLAEAAQGTQYRHISLLSRWGEKILKRAVELFAVCCPIELKFPVPDWDIYHQTWQFWFGQDWTTDYDEERAIKDFEDCWQQALEEERRP